MNLLNIVGQTSIHFRGKRGIKKKQRGSKAQHFRGESPQGKYY